MEKKIIHLTQDMNEIYELLSQMMGENVSGIIFNKLNAESAMKKIDENNLITMMENDMKIAQSQFYHVYNKENQDIIIQKCGEKIAIFYE